MMTPSSIRARLRRLESRHAARQLTSFENFTDASGERWVRWRHRRGNVAIIVAEFPAKLTAEAWAQKYTPPTPTPIGGETDG